MIALRSKSENPCQVRMTGAASPACASIASRIVVYWPWWPNPGSLYAPQSLCVRNAQLALASSPLF